MQPLLPDVVVNGQTIASEAIAAEAQHHKAPAGKPDMAWQAAAKAMVVRTLLLQEASRLGVTTEPQAVAKDKWETDDEALIRALLEREIEPQEVTETACKTLYENYPETFKSPSLFQPAHILFAAPPGDKQAREAAKQSALTALASLAKNPRAFAKMAQANSDCSSKEKGGALGQIGPGDTVPEFESILEILPAGEMYPEPVETRFGIHVVRMDKKSEGVMLPFDTVKSQIREKLEQLAWAKAANALTKRLVDQAAIEGIELVKLSTNGRNTSGRTA